MLVITVGTKRLVEIVNRRGRNGVQRRRHRRRKDGCHYETGKPGWHVLRNKIGKHAIAAGERKSGVGCGCVTRIGKGMIKSKQQDADKQKTNKLGQYDRTD